MQNSMFVFSLSGEAMDIGLLIGVVPFGMSSMSHWLVLKSKDSLLSSLKWSALTVGVNCSVFVKVAL